jgi:hypothetical protein
MALPFLRHAGLSGATAPRIPGMRNAVAVTSAGLVPAASMALATGGPPKVTGSAAAGG